MAYQLTQEELTAQNAARGISQVNTGTAKTGVAISSESLAPASPVDVTPPTDNNNYQGILNSGRALLDSYLKNLTPPPSTADAYKAEYAQSGIDPLSATNQANTAALKKAKDRLNSVSARLAGYSAEADAIPIRSQQDATGRGITAAGLAPIQSAQLRDNALRSLPLQAEAIAAQAEVEAAQGDVELSQNSMKLAQDKLDTVFQLRSKDAEAQYNFKRDTIAKLYDYASAEQKTKLDLLQRADDKKFQEQQAFRKYGQELSNTAIENGAANVAAQISALDPASPTYQRDLAALAGRIPQKADLQFISGTDNQAAGVFDKTTGKFRAAGGGGGTGGFGGGSGFGGAGGGGGGSGAGPYTPGKNPVIDSWVKRINNDEADISSVPSNIRNAVVVALGSSTNLSDKKTKRIENQVSNAATVAGKVGEALRDVNKFGATGFIGGATKTISGTPSYILNSTLDTIKANLGFDELQAMREASPTGGALGQVAVQELTMLQSTVASLDTGLDSKTLSRNLKQVGIHYRRWLNTVGYELTPDWQVVKITD